MPVRESDIQAVLALAGASPDSPVRNQLTDPAHLRRVLNQMQANGEYGSSRYNTVMQLFSEMNPDQFDILARESALQSLRLQRKTTRVASFVTGPRGLEGPLANLIGGGGASTLGR